MGKNSLNKILLIFCLLLTQCGCEPIKTEGLHCDCNIEEVKQSIQKITNADSVIIYKKYLQEELYFEKMIYPVILIVNPTTEILDFKALPLGTSYRFENYREIEDELRIDGFPFAEKIIECCNVSNCNDVIVEFIKYDEPYAPYRFICHYPELLK